jgi:hypothetical protein
LKCHVYIKRLQSIPENKHHPILDELSKAEVFNSIYQGGVLMGHEILKILIDRAPDKGVDDAWYDLVMKIAGDPRVSASHPRYVKWWAFLEQKHVNKVMGWLSHLDLKLFLEALEDYSYSSNKPDLQRMFPARKQFLLGMLDKGIITKTRLYLSTKASAYIKRAYLNKADKKVDFNYSTIIGNEISVIHVEVGDYHMVEGSHSCKLRIYSKLNANHTLFNWEKKRVSYEDVTSSIEKKERGYGHVIASLVHTKANSSWQRKAVQSFNDLGVDLSMRDVLTPQDFNEYEIDYKRKNGLYY